MPNIQYLPRLAVSPTGATTDSSGAHTGADIVAIAANAKRIGLIIGNPDPANTMYVNFGAAAVVGGPGSIPLLPGVHLALYGTALPAEAVHVIGVVASNYTCKEIA